jgi:hypothetical protein
MAKEIKQNKNKTNVWCILGFIFALIFPLGIIFSIIGIYQIKESKERGKGLAMAGIIISGLLILLSLGMILFFEL